ncbi:MAG: L-threonylcarbamoyladenylate synthase [Rhodothermales bacterium]
MGVTRLLDSAEEAAALLRAGRLVAFPTETVYGLGASALDANAIAGIFRAKGRPADNPLIVHVASVDDVAPLVVDVPPPAARFMEAFWPGPLSIVLRRSEVLADGVAAGLDTVALRMPDHPAALAMLRAAGIPVAAPSANRSGRPSPTTWEAVMDDLDGRIDAVLKGGGARVGLESTVVDCTTAEPVVLRRGSIGLADLRSIEPATRLAASGELETGRSPGVRHPHYRPEGRVLLARADAPLPPGAAWLGLHPPSPDTAEFLRRVEVVPTVEDYARRLFAYFRTCEKEGIRDIVCEDLREPTSGPTASNTFPTVPESAIHSALLDRLERASH